MDYKRTKEYLPRVHRTRQIDEELRESYCTLEKRLFHKGRIVTPSFISKNNMRPFFKVVSLEPFLTLNEPICPRFVVEFYHSLEVKRDEELHPYIEFKLGLGYSFVGAIISLPQILKPFKEKGKKIASLSIISSSSSSSDDNEAPSFLKFYDELSDIEDLTKA
ncbi:hypothetical protein Tco_0445276 [Tanacetum coccineum]